MNASWIVLSACRWAGADPELQQVGGMVRGARHLRPGRLGAVQLRDAGQLAWEALVVPRADLAQRRRVPAELRHQWQLPGAREREQSRPAEHLAALRGQSLPLPHQRGRQRQGNHLPSSLQLNLANSKTSIRQTISSFEKTFVFKREITGQFKYFESYHFTFTNFEVNASKIPITFHWKRLLLVWHN